MPVTPEGIPATIATGPIQTFHDALTNWADHKADAPCAAQALSFITDQDVISILVRFATGVVFQPGIAEILSAQT